jgi:hypothetical protein
MKLEINKQNKAVEIELPVYRKAICHYYKVYSWKLHPSFRTLEDHLRVEFVVPN